MRDQISVINLEALHKLCKGDINKEYKYLNKFLEMMPLSIQKLKFAYKKEDRIAIMKELHFMLPQLVFYGIEDFIVLIEREETKKGRSFKYLKNQINEGILKIEKALKEVEYLINK